jgi:hypothetical protein
MLNQARAIRAAYPDVGAMRELPVGDPPPESTGETEWEAALRAALGYLRDEMLLVRAGKANDLTVLNDEIAGVERLLAGL